MIRAALPPMAIAVPWCVSAASPTGGSSALRDAGNRQAHGEARAARLGIGRRHPSS